MNESMSAEAKALHAALAGDIEDVRRVLSTFLRHELIELMGACADLTDCASEALSDLAADQRRERRVR